MNYYKKTLILTPTDNFSYGQNAVLTAKTDGNEVVFNFTYSETSVLPENSVIIIYDGDGKTFVQPDGKRDCFRFPANVKDNLSAYLIADGKILMKGYVGKLGVTDKEILDFDKTNNEKEYSAFDTPKRNQVYEKQEYDDEAVADFNYYDKDEVEIQSFEIKDDYDKPDYNQNAMLTDAYDGKNKEEEISSYATQNETDENPFRSDETAVTYYDKIKENVEKVLSSFPEEKNLQNAVSGSKWVKIRYEDDKYYAFGVVYSNQVPLYVCYGVPGCSGNKPKVLDGYCFFLPTVRKNPFSALANGLFGISQTDTDDTPEGFWIMCQDAKTGQCIIYK